MAVATWKNIAPVNSAGILNAINESGKTIGTGIAGIGDAFTQYSDNRSTQETNDLVAALAMAGNEADRDAVMQSMDPNSFADKSLVAEAYKEANIVADPSWVKQQEIKQRDKMFQIFAENKGKNKSADKNSYTAADFDATLFKKNNKDEDINFGMPVLRWLGLSDSPREEVTGRLGEYYRTNNMTPDEIVRFNKIMGKDFDFDKSWADEFVSLAFGTDVEDLSDAQLAAIAKMGGFQTDAFIQAEKEKKKTK
jgi:hypothetical protein